MHKKLKEKAIQLRLSKGLGYSAIRKRVPVSKSTLSVWLRNFPLGKERIDELKRASWSKSEIKIEKYRATMREKREKRDRKEYQNYLKCFKKAIPQEAFFTSGLMLYLAEGGKTSNYVVSLANTDARMINFFIKWLRKFFDIPKSRLRVHLHLYGNMHIEKENNFWKNELGLNYDQFYKPYITAYKKASFLYKESFRHGTCSIILADTLIKRKIMAAIRAYVDTILSAKSF